jgi:hypothetical protein
MQPEAEPKTQSKGRSPAPQATFRPTPHLPNFALFCASLPDLWSQFGHNRSRNGHRPLGNQSNSSDLVPSTIRRCGAPY